MQLMSCANLSAIILFRSKMQGSVRSCRGTRPGHGYAGITGHKKRSRKQIQNLYQQTGRVFVTAPKDLIVNLLQPASFLIATMLKQFFLENSGFCRFLKMWTSENLFARWIFYPYIWVYLPTWQIL